MNFSRGNISNAKKALTEKMEFETYQSCLIPSHTFLQVQTQVIGSKSDSLDKISNCRSFHFCCLQNRICYVCTVSWMELFLRRDDFRLSGYSLTRHIAWFKKKNGIKLISFEPGFKTDVVIIVERSLSTLETTFRKLSNGGATYLCGSTENQS